MLSLPVILAVSLAGCFDLSQNVSVGRDGTGHYRVAVAAEGFIGQALKSKSDKDLIGGNPARTTTSDINGRVTRVSVVDFKSLSDLKLGEEAMSISHAWARLLRPRLHARHLPLHLRRRSRAAGTMAAMRATSRRAS